MKTNCSDCIIKSMNSLKYLEDNVLGNITEYKCSTFYPKGETLFEEGSNLLGVYCIKEGVCKLTKLSVNGKCHIIRFAKKGDILGYSSIIGQAPVNLSAVVLKDMKVCFIPKDIIFDSFSKNRAFSADLVKEFCRELYKADSMIVDMIQKSVKERLADVIMNLNNTFGLNKEGYIDIQLSREDIASIVGTATESLIRMLSSFSKSGVIETKGKQIKVLDEWKLRRISMGAEL